MKEISDVKPILEVPQAETTKPDIKIKPTGEMPSQQADNIFDKICETDFEKTENPKVEISESKSNSERIDNPSNMSLKEADGVFDKLFDSEESNEQADEGKDVEAENTGKSDDENDESTEKEPGISEKSDSNNPESGETDEHSQSQNTFSDLNTMKKVLGKNYKEIKEDKPMNSPKITNWFEKGGSIKVENTDKKSVWTYIDKDGKEVKYVDGYPVFPPEAKHPVIGDINIGRFTDRGQDKENYKEKLKELYELTEIPEGYILHHDSENGNMQLIKEDWHTEFRHAGGFSKYKEG